MSTERKKSCVWAEKMSIPAINITANFRIQISFKPLSN